MLAERFLRFRRLAKKVAKRLERITRRRKTVYVWDRVPYYRELWEAAARRRGMQFVVLAEDFWEIRGENGQSALRVNNYCVELDNPVVLRLAGEKVLTYKLLEERGLPVAPHAVFTLDALQVLRDFLACHVGPFVVKPVFGTSAGIGVTTHVNSYQDSIDAALLASLYSKTQLIEKFVPGEVYRLLFVGGNMISAVRRTGLRLKGDGETSLAKLVEAYFNSRPKLGQFQGWRKDHDLRATTASQGLMPGTVLELGEEVLVKSVAKVAADKKEIRTVYDQDVTHTLCRSIVEQAREAVFAVRSEFCGVDLILLDPTSPLGVGNGVVGEVNTTPGLHHHDRVAGADKREDVADAVLDYYFSSRENRKW